MIKRLFRNLVSIYLLAFSLAFLLKFVMSFYEKTCDCMDSNNFVNWVKAILMIGIFILSTYAITIAKSDITRATPISKIIERILLTAGFCWANALFVAHVISPPSEMLKLWNTDQPIYMIVGIIFSMALLIGGIYVKRASTTPVSE